MAPNMGKTFVKCFHFSKKAFPVRFRYSSKTRHDAWNATNASIYGWNAANDETNDARGSTSRRYASASDVTWSHCHFTST